MVLSNNNSVRSYLIMSTAIRYEYFIYSIFKYDKLYCYKIH